MTELAPNVLYVIFRDEPGKATDARLLAFEDGSQDHRPVPEIVR
ncbi:MAG: hypothetical protein ACRDFR_04575 [Candidatus Limnocylindria bacterium]